MTCWCQIAYLLGTSWKATNRVSLTQIRVHHRCNCFPLVAYNSRHHSKNLNGDKRTRSGKYLHFLISGAFGHGDSGLVLGHTVRTSSRFCKSICLEVIDIMMIGPSKILLADWSSTGSITTLGTRVLACFRCQVLREVYINDKIVFGCCFCGIYIPYESRNEMISLHYHPNCRQHLHIGYLLGQWPRLQLFL